jgi:hypothetical protein
MEHFGRDDLQSGLLETTIDFSDDILGDGIGFDNRQGTLNGHLSTPHQMKKDGLRAADLR